LVQFACGANARVLALAVSASVAGLLVSYNTEVPAGPAIVLTAGALWLISLSVGLMPACGACTRRPTCARLKPRQDAPLSRWRFSDADSPLAATGPPVRAVVHGNLVHLAGQVTDHPDLDTEGQTADVLSQIDGLLAEAGTDKSHLLTCQVFLADMAMSAR